MASAPFPDAPAGAEAPAPEPEFVVCTHCPLLHDQDDIGSPSGQLPLDGFTVHDAVDPLAYVLLLNVHSPLVPPAAPQLHEKAPEAFGQLQIGEGVGVDATQVCIQFALT